MAKDTTATKDTPIRIGDVVTVKSGEARHSSTPTVIGLHTDDTGQDCATLM